MTERQSDGRTDGRKERRKKRRNERKKMLLKNIVFRFNGKYLITMHQKATIGYHYVRFK